MTTITLKEPIELRSAKDGKVVHSITELTLRKPKAGDLVAALDACGGDQNRMGSIIRVLAARCTDITTTQFDELGLEDGSALIEAVAGFLGNGLATGLPRSGLSSAPSASPPAGSGGPPLNSAS